MCSRRTRVALVAALAVGGLAGAGPVSAQAGAQARLGEGELLRQLDAAMPELEEARRAVEGALARRAREAAARPRRPTDVVEVGPLRVVTLPEQAELAAELFEEVWREDFHSVVGSPALAAHVFAFQWGWRSVQPLDVDAEAHGATAVQRVEVTRSWVRTRRVARARIRDSVWDALRKDLPEGTPLAEWVGRTGYPSVQRVSRLVTMVPSDLYRSCLEGEDAACLAGLGLATTATTERGLPPETTTMVLLEAVRLGGAGAWQRLVGVAGAQPLDALERVAGVAPEAVVASWRTALLDERPEVHAGLGSQSARVIVWLIFLAMFAARSSRWRLT